jgi:hypothetical protein
MIRNMRGTINGTVPGGQQLVAGQHLRFARCRGRPPEPCVLGSQSVAGPARARPSPGARVSALHGSRQGFQDPLAASSPLARPLAPIEPLHGQSILEVLRTRPLTAPAPGSDRRLSGEAHQVGGHSHRSDHEPRGSLPGLQGRRPGTRPCLHVRREGAHLRARDLPDVSRNRAVRSGASQDRRAIGVPLTPGRSSTSRSLRGSRLPSSGDATRLITAICKQGLRNRLPDRCGASLTNLSQTTEQGPD